MSNDIERSESEAEAEKAAREEAERWRYDAACVFAQGKLTLSSYAQKEIQRRFEKLFLAGVEWERKRLRTDDPAGFGDYLCLTVNNSYREWRVVRFEPGAGWDFNGGIVGWKEITEATEAARE